MTFTQIVILPSRDLLVITKLRLQLYSIQNNLFSTKSLFLFCIWYNGSLAFIITERWGAYFRCPISVSMSLPAPRGLCLEVYIPLYLPWIEYYTAVFFFRPPPHESKPKCSQPDLNAVAGDKVVVVEHRDDKDIESPHINEILHQVWRRDRSL